ncbi:MAG: Hpt domain-containing protein [bacterium]|nr:Hpt domain-containing protein [bacterium]
MIDRELLDTRKILGKEFFEGLLVKFERDSVPMLEQLKELNKAHKLSELSDAAHRIKGIAANVGAKSLAELCYKIQLGAEAGESSNLTAWIDQLPSQLTEAMTELKEYMKTF